MSSSNDKVDHPSHCWSVTFAIHDEFQWFFDQRSDFRLDRLSDAVKSDLLESILRELFFPCRTHEKEWG